MNSGRERREATAVERARGRPGVPPTANGRTTLSEDEVRRMIAEAAYLRAAQRGFVPGGDVDDWLAAEQEVRAALEGRAARHERAPDGAMRREGVHSRATTVRAGAGKES